MHPIENTVNKTTYDSMINITFKNTEINERYHKTQIWQETWETLFGGMNPDVILSMMCM